MAAPIHESVRPNTHHSARDVLRLDMATPMELEASDVITVAPVPRNARL